MPGVRTMAATRGSTLLDLRVRRKRYHDGANSRVVLHDIAVTAGPGQVLALLGQSGAGKTTLLRILLGLDRAFDGSVALPPGRVGVVFQEPRLLPWLTVEQNLRVVLTPDMRQPDLVGLLELVGLTEAAGRHPGALSLGMARRAAVARALAIDPAVLVLDEPFVSLDPRRAGILGGLLRQRAREHGTLVVATMHDVEHAVQIADRILVLTGDPATLAADLAVPPRNDATAREALLGELLSRFAFLASVEQDHVQEIGA